MVARGEFSSNSSGAMASELSFGLFKWGQSRAIHLELGLAICEVTARNSPRNSPGDGDILATDSPSVVRRAWSAALTCRPVPRGESALRIEEGALAGVPNSASSTGDGAILSGKR